jgi:hypothetical protein
MNTKIKRWTARIVGTAALPTVLALGLGGLTQANAEPTAVATHAASTQHVSPVHQYYWAPVYWTSSYSQAYNWNRHYNYHNHYRYNIRYYSDFYYSGRHHHNVWVVYWYE